MPPQKEYVVKALIRQTALAIVAVLMIAANPAFASDRESETGYAGELGYAIDSYSQLTTALNLYSLTTYGKQIIPTLKLLKDTVAQACDPLTTRAHTDAEVNACFARTNAVIDQLNQNFQMAELQLAAFSLPPSIVMKQISADQNLQQFISNVTFTMTMELNPF